MPLTRFNDMKLIIGSVQGSSPEDIPAGVGQIEGTTQIGNAQTLADHALHDATGNDAEVALEYAIHPTQLFTGQLNLGFDSPHDFPGEIKTGW